MSLSAKIREQIINSFRAELAEHVQTMNNGLLALEQQTVVGAQRSDLLADIFRAAHSLKGAARAVGVSAIEQLAHALEDVLGAMQQERLEASPALFTACFKAIDAIQLVQAAYESGETTPPAEALQALATLGAFQKTKVAAPPAVETASGGRPSKKIQKNNLEAMTGLLADPLAPDAPQVMESPQPPASPLPMPETLPPEEGAPALNPAPANMLDETIRVSVNKLDSLMAQLSELLITKIHAEQRMAQVHQAQEYMATWQKDWLAARNAYSHLTRYGLDSQNSKELGRLLDYVANSQDRLREMSALINALSRQYSSDTMQMSLIIDGLEEEIKRVRMLPFSTATGLFRRMVRDLAHISKKQILLEIYGHDVELDKRVLEQIKDPIIHMLRNAVDHGIETPDARLAAGKDPQGKITLEARQVGKDVSITVSDDGAGLNIQGIRQTAIRRGIANAQGMTDAELVDLIFHPGFSTSPIITDLSGRGVGLDVVRRNVESVGGRINVEWNAGVGSAFTLLLPLALTSSRALMVRVAGQQFAIPLSAIERIEYVNPGDVLSVGGHETIEYNNRPLTLVHLGDVLGLPPVQQSSQAYLPVVILAAAERRMAFVVDELADEQEVVMKGLGRQLARVGGIAGASLMGNGEVLLILNVADLIKLAQRGTHRSVLEKADSTEAAPIPERPQRRILVVDDSITTRTLEKNILEAAGFNVRIATDGIEAYNAVVSGELPDLIISDVSMPRLDGLGLAQRIKSDPRTAKVPFILVTSLDSPEDKARGIEVGADAYIVKSSFDQNNLLETIEQLI